MPFVEASYQGRSKDSNACPAERPLRSSGRSQGAPKCPEQQNAKQAVTEDVSGLANVVMPDLECWMVHAEEEVQQRIQNPAGIGGRKIGRRFDRDDD